MALTRVIPIKQVKLTPDDVATLLTEISSHYRRSKDLNLGNYYSLSIDQDEHTSITLDSPPKNFKSLLDTRVSNIVLRIENRQPSRKIELQLTHGDTSIYRNKIEIHAHDEDWVNHTWKKLTDKIAALEPQPTFANLYYKFAFIVISALSGWFIVNMLIRVIKLFLPMSFVIAASSSDVTSNVFLYFNVTLLVFIIGFWPTSWLFSYAKDAYPSVELQIGPSRDRLEPNRRLKLKWICGIFIVGPSANFLYDLYRYVLPG